MQPRYSRGGTQSVHVFRPCQTPLVQGGPLVSGASRRLRLGLLGFGVGLRVELGVGVGLGLAKPEP